MNEIIVNIVKGSDGASLQITDNKGSGNRIAGPKAWGNPYNKPTFIFKIDADEFIRLINEYKYETQEEDCD